MQHLLPKCLLVLPLLTLAACGGGSGGGGQPVQPPAPVTLDLAFEPSQSGFATSGGAAASSTVPTAGDSATNLEFRALLTFSLGPIPAGVTVTAAELRVSQDAVFGNPHTDFSALSVDHVDLGGTLDAPDFGSAALSTPGNLLPFDAALGTKVRDVLSQVNADRTALRTSSSFRLRMVGAPSVDATSDRITAGPQTILRVTYQP